MPSEYVLLIISGDHTDVEPTKMQVARITKLEKLQENKLEAQNNVGVNQWSKFLWSQQKNTKKKFQFGVMSYGFPKDKKHIWANSRKYGLVHSGYNIAYPIILFFLFLLTILNQTQYSSMLIS
jgi:hypothetical protein